MSYKAAGKTFSYQTRYRLEFIDITNDAGEFVSASGIRTGTVTLQTHHTTCGLWVNEDEKNLIGPEETLGYTPDLKRILDRFASPTEKYGHNDIRNEQNPNGKRNTHLCMPDENGVIHECVNGHAHAQSLILPCYLTLIIENSKVLLGEWQKILLVELDHDRPRTVTMLAQGSTS